jgi:Helix-turn-helix domain
VSEPIRLEIELSESTIVDIAARVAPLLARSNEDGAAASSEPWPPWLSRRDAARYTSLSPTTIGRLRKSGQIPFRLVNSRYVYPRAGLDAFLNARPGKE